MGRVTIEFDPLTLFGPLDRSKEQIVPGHDSNYWLEFHLAFYRYAEPRARGDVLDLGCGYGYGSELLSRKAKSVTGLDYHHPAIEYNRSHYSAPNLRFVEHDANTPLPFPDSSFDLVVSSEVLEHIDRRHDLLREIARVGRRGGHLILKTPNAASAAPESNPHHHHTYSLEEFQDEIRGVFPNAEIYRWVPRTEVKQQVVDFPVKRETGAFGEPFPSEKALLVYFLTTPLVVPVGEGDLVGDLLAVCPIRQ
ncbi:MAG: class I SAM-dependent methyltransferase [Candidatus Omnitrophica bacterium]|nr:Ubiquinone biosynthesis O-methyltransferase [bacterium]NUN97877.1 class I SAM-dependent methyltransferase [Candidatus Omnitrophota bacterium]